MIDRNYNDVKVYQIDLDFHEFKEFKADHKRVIDHIIEYHKDNFKSVNDLSYSESALEIEPCTFQLYSFVEQEKESIWKDFLPKELIGQNEFTIKSTSFVLFIQIGKRLFAVIGGIGMSVIKRFLNESFGLDFYEKIADPAHDIVHMEISRGVSGNLSSEQRTFRNEQRLQDVLSIGRVPKKFYLQLRTELRDSLFDFIDFENADNIYIEIGVSFCIKWKIDFIQLHQLIIKINEVLDFSSVASLSRFERVKEADFIQRSLLPALLTYLRNDVVKRLAAPSISYSQLLDYDFIHPSKWRQFYECDSYRAYIKGSRKPFFETHDRTVLYHAVLKHVYSLVRPTDEYNFRSILLGVKVKGFVGETCKTVAMFINHLTCELSIGSTTFFFIDNKWYKLKGSFIDDINDQCLQILKKNLLIPNPLDLDWSNKSEKEGDYNLKYSVRENYWVLDKMLGQNIELCDIAVLRDKTLYLIHVKDGFDAKLRDLSNQVSISSQRLWNDLKTDRSFLREVYDKYSQSGNNISGITRDNFYQLFLENKIIFVMAFTSSKRGKTILENLNEHKSNIAKFSVIQSFRERIDNYSVQIIEIKKQYLE